MKGHSGRVANSLIQRAVFVVHDMDEAIPRYEAMTGAKLHKTGEAVEREAGVLAAADFNHGIELASPLPGNNSVCAKHMRDYLAKNGESLYSVVYTVDELEPWIDRAKSLGLKILVGPFCFTQREIDEEFGGQWTRFDEVIFANPSGNGFLVAYNVIHWK